MGEKLRWEEISKQFDGEWVLLVDYDWDDTQPYPSAGIVECHAPGRKEFNRLAKASQSIDAARVFVGKPAQDANVVTSYNVFKMTSVE